MSKPKDDKEKKVSWEQVLGELEKSPELLRVALQKAGIQVKDPEKKEEKKRERPKFELDPESELPDLIKKLNESLNGLAEFLEGTVSDKIDALKPDIEAAKGAPVRNKLQELIAKVGKETFEKVLPVMNGLYQKSGDLEDSFDRACKAMDIPNPLKKGKKSKTNEEEDEENSDEGTPPRSFKSSEESETPGKGSLKAKTVSIKDAAKKNLDRILAEADGKLDEDELE